MIHGSLYKRISQHQRLVCKQIIDEFAHKFKWRPKGHDTIMDIGCGTGDLIADCILPILPQQFSRLVCSDISSEMISIASETVRSPKASFEILDIGVPLDESVWSEPFDHITSFYCLHWTSDQLQVMKNIYNLLSPSGDCLLTFVCSHPAFAIYHQLSKRPRWSQYMQDIHKLIPPFQFSENAAKDLDTIMHKVGFCERSVQVRDISWEFDGLDHLKCKCIYFDRK